MRPVELAVVICLAIPVWASTPLEVTKCSNNAALPLIYTVDGCDALPCSVVNGEIINAQLEFLVPNTTSVLATSLRVFFLNIELPYDMPEDKKNACNQLVDSNCPIEGGRVVRVDSAIEVVSPIVNIEVSLEFTIKDDADNIIICFISETHIA